MTTPIRTSLFAREAAVVTGQGSPLAHAAFAAREIGIPAVVGAVEAPQLWRRTARWWL